MLTREQKTQNSFNFFLNTYFNVILSFIVVLALTSAYIMLIRPKYQETMMAISFNLEQQQRLLVEQQKKLNNLKAVADLYDKVPAADLNKFNEVLPDSYVKERLFGELEEIISQNGFVVNSIQLAESSEEDAGSRGEIEINLSLSAIDYPGLKRTLRLLETNLRLFDVKQVDFSPGDNSVNLILITYYYKK
jgi:hypothetical protein